MCHASLDEAIVYNTIRTVMKSTPEPSRGRPRSASIDAAVLDAVRALLSETDYQKISIAAIAERAGTTRQAIYRRWSNKALIVLDAMFTETNSTEIPDLGDLRAELRLITQSLANEFNNPVARATVSGLLMDLRNDAQLHTRVREALLEPEHARVQAIFERAIERGEVGATTAIPILVEMIGGAVVYRTCFIGLPADDNFIDEIVNLAILATRKEPK